MERTLDLNEFERLSGEQFWAYISPFKDLRVDEHFVDYFRERKAQLDYAHLEVALYLLANSGLPTAYHELACFLDDPRMTLRYLAIGSLEQMKSGIDAAIMSRVVQALEGNAPTRFQRRTLESFLLRGSSDEARAIAHQHAITQPTRGEIRPAWRERLARVLGWLRVWR